MWFSGTHKLIGQVDVKPALDFVKRLSDEDWLRNSDKKQRLAKDRPVDALYFRHTSDKQAIRIPPRRAFEESDVSQFEHPIEAADDIVNLLIEVARIGMPGAIIVRAQLSRLRGGGAIRNHVDSGMLLRSSLRIHVPIVTHNRVEFVVDNETIDLSPGYIYELNNLLPHSVMNPEGCADRVHLIMDLLPKPSTTLFHRWLFQFENRLIRSKQDEKTSPREPALHSTSTTEPLPKVLATSVVRGADQSESHGGVYLVDLTTEDVKQVVDWNTVDIDFSGRGAGPRVTWYRL